MRFFEKSPLEFFQMPRLYAVLALFLLCGIAVQGPLLDLAVIVPVVYLWRRGMRANEALFLRRFGLTLLALWAVFPVVDIYHWIAHTHEVPAPPVRTLFASRLSSTIFVSAATFVVAGFFAVRKQREPKPVTIAAGQFLWWASVGLAACSLLTAPYYVFQAITGFSYKTISGHLDGREEWGLFRISGFFGNSIWVGAVTLGLFCFSWYLFWYVFAERTRRESAFRNLVTERSFVWARKIFPWTLLGTAVLQFGFILLSGSRTVSLLAFAFLTMIPFLVKMSPTGNLVRMWGLGSSMLVAASTFLAMGFASRIFNTMKVMNEGQNVSSRSDIWRVHFAIFQDFPVLGAGNNWMQAGIREQYYSKMIEPQFFPNFKSLLAHNLYLQILCDVGVVGAVAVVCLVAYGAWLLWKQLRGKFVARTVGVAFALAFGANLVHGVTENTYFASNISLVTLFLLLVVIWTSFFEGREGTGGGA